MCVHDLQARTMEGCTGRDCGHFQLAFVLDDADSGEHGSSDDRLGRLRAARILASGDGMNDGPGRHDDERGAAGGAQKQQQGRRRAHGFGCTRVKDTARRWKFVEVPGLSA